MMNRRQLLKALLASGVGLSNFTATASQLKLMNAYASQTQFTDYKALVCIFLYGGNDSYNMLIPTQNADYNIYNNVRQNLAIEQSALLPLNTISNLPYSVGVPNYMSGIEQLFSQGKLSFINNVGPLVEPTTKAMINANTATLPPQLFSHNDQQSLWQTSGTNLQSITGWSGKMADLILEQNPTPIAVNISLSGTNTLQNGINTQAYRVTADGAPEFSALNPKHDWNTKRITLLDELIALDTHHIGKAYSTILNRARNNTILVNQALDQVPEFSTTFSNNNLADDLSMVAKLIAARNDLSMNRQVFFVGVGGWDTHDRQLQDHPQLLSRLSNTLVEFNQAIEELGLANSVTTFTASDFGRTLTSNGDGTDHGWGGHQMVMGGAINGGQFFGQLPELALNSNDDFGDGRIIPTTSVDQYSAALARWFGLSESHINEIFPHLDRFPSGTLNLFS